MTHIDFCTKLLSLEESLMKLAYRFNLKQDDAKDLVQETYLKVLARKEMYVDRDNFKAWTFAIMRNIFIDNYRRTLRQKVSYYQTSELFFINKTEIFGSEDPDSAFAVLEITQNIDQLKEKLRIPFKMYISGYKYTEIADKLNMNISTVKSRIFLSRKQLMGQLNN